MNPDEAILLALISIGAFFIPLVCRRLLVPSAVGEIVFGLLLGLVFGNIPGKLPTIRFLSELGFILLMYLAGLEIDFQLIKATPRGTIARYLFFYGLVIGCSFGTAAYLGQHPFYGLIYLTVAVGLLFPVLKDTGLLGEDFGRSFLILGCIGEVISIAALIVFMLYLRFGFSLETLLHLVELAGFLLICYLLLKAFKLYVWWHPTKIGVFLQTGDVAETGIRANFVTMFVFVSLAALFDIELIIGAFLGGMLFGLVFKKRSEIVEKMGALGYGFLIPIFFIEVGLRFSLKDFIDLQVCRQALVTALLIFLIRVLCSPVFLFSSFSLRQIMLIPVGLSFALTLLVALAAIGQQEGIFQAQEASAILLAAVITALVFPWIFKVLARRTAPSGT